MDLDERLGDMLRQALAFAGTRHGVPMVAHPAAVENQRIGGAGAGFAACADGDEARPAVRREKAAVAKEAPVLRSRERRLRPLERDEERLLLD